MTIILRRRKLGRTSCNEIARLSKTGIVAVRNDQPMPAGHDMVIRWGTTSNLDREYGTVLNSAKAIHWVADKATSRKLMADVGLSPKTWLSALDTFVEDVEGFIVRPNVHAQGRNVHYSSTWDGVVAVAKEYGEGGYYISEFIDKVAEYRVFVVSGRVACVARKTPADEKAIAWNVAQGGRFDNVKWSEWPLEACRVAIDAFDMSGLDFGGVDVMVDADGKAYVLEINSAPSLTSPYRQECMAKAFDYIVTNGNSHIPTGGNDWKGYVHPAISDQAR